ncbi:pentatricopeptide repeat-containing protein At5g04780, mitochondrial-like [Cucurbita maxima]|uniref:Pentatricopeptide repeat-containing protein At5g04780, mitochondrial-like n=1 Tax=Cucurbita maxima TaxID=3661 RepID=A0A6J1HTF6_CUCMA|nr:pentatricopeptide repeat-containing protein At5g04780, mitochondrial-like [Cucurbita maxima]
MWTMNCYFLNSLRSFLCSPLKPFATITHLFTSTKFINTSVKCISDLRTNDVSGFIQNGSGNTSSISYSKLLLEFTASKDVKSGMEIHARMLRLGLCRDTGVRNKLINLYSKCQCFPAARKLVMDGTEPDLVSWSALISGYAQNGRGEEALLTFYEMHLLGVKGNEFTFPSVLKACSLTRNLELGKQIHGIALVTGFESDVFVANTLVVMYAKCGEFSDSKKLFEEIPERNVVSWNALFSCYVQIDFFSEAINLFREMVSTGITPNEFSLSTVLNACAGLEHIDSGMEIHGYLIKLGYDSDPFSANALLDMYAKAGCPESAIAVFYEIPKPDIVSWNAVIAGCVLHEYNDLALKLFGMMGSFRVSPNMFTLSSALKACAGLGLIKIGRQLHSALMMMNMDSDSFVGVGLIDMYSKCGLLQDARKVFDLIPKRDSIAWNSIISSYSNCGYDMEAISLFTMMYKEGLEFNQTTLSTILKSSAGSQAIAFCEQVHVISIKSGYQYDGYVANSLLDSYGKGCRLEEAEKVFEECPAEDLVAYTSMITAYSQYGLGEEALKMYLCMQERCLKPDAFIFSSLFNACANLSAYEQGKQIHVHVLKCGLLSDVFAGNSLVNMYAKCGSIDDATSIFSEIPWRGIVSWSAMIGGLAQHGHGKKALQLFYQMLKDGIPPNHITLVSVLSACNHGGLVTEARRFFGLMEELFGIIPTQEHYACMVDILGRVGRLDEAMELVKEMPFQGNAAVWGALLGAARIHKNIELGRQAAEMLLTLEPEKSGTHVLLANIYASTGMWDNVAKIRKMMKDSLVKKEPGMSWIEVKDKVYTFIVGDRNHPRSIEIYAKVDELRELLSKAGYFPMIETDLHDVEQTEKEEHLWQHSEKLAVAFGLIATPPGAPIRVKKNLRVCIDCHTAFKFISKLVAREIIVRDLNRFHHFRDGSCSCADYW